MSDISEVKEKGFSLDKDVNKNDKFGYFCPICGKSYSSYMPACPNCGAGLEKIDSKNALHAEQYNINEDLNKKEYAKQNVLNG